jgi:hypothetical protein
MAGDSVTALFRHALALLVSLHTKGVERKAASSTSAAGGLAKTESLTFTDALYLFDTDHVVQSDEVGVFFIGGTKRIRCTVTATGQLLEPGTGKRYNSLEHWLEVRSRRSSSPYQLNDVGFGKVRDGHLLPKGRLTMADVVHRLETLQSIAKHSPHAFKRLVLRYNAIQAGTYDWITEVDEWDEEGEDHDDGEWTTMWAEEEEWMKVGEAVAV